MKPDRLKECLAALDLSQDAAGYFLGYNVTTINRWATDKKPVPRVVALLLETMIAKNISPDEAKAITFKRRHHAHAQ